MSDEQTTNSPLAEDLAQLRIAVPMRCNWCGYDLFGLGADSDCPECSKAVRLTIFDTVDPVSKRLEPLEHPVFVGNLVLAIVLCSAIAGLFAIAVSFIFPPQFIQLPEPFQAYRYTYLCNVSSMFGVLGLVSVIVLLRHLYIQKELASCRKGLMIAGFGMLLWALFMVLFPATLGYPRLSPPQTSLFLHTLFPACSASLVFLGFKMFIPQIGRRSRSFRQAQANRQRMNDMLGALCVAVIGRYLMVTTVSESLLYTFGGILEVMSLALITVGLGYVVWNTLWIRNALVTPPPALQELLRPIDGE